MAEKELQHLISAMAYRVYDKKAPLLTRELKWRAHTTKRPKSVCRLNRQRDAFTIFTPDGQRDLSTEDLFGRHENDAQKGLYKLAHGPLDETGRVESLNNIEMEAVAHLLFGYSMRTNPARGRFEKKVDRGDFLDPRSNFPIGPASSSGERHNAFAELIGGEEDIERAARMLYLKSRWDIVQFDEDVLFHSDAPLYSSVARDKYSSVVRDKFVAGIPLSPRRYLLVNGSPEELLKPPKIPGLNRLVFRPPLHKAMVCNAYTVEQASQVYGPERMRHLLDKQVLGWIPRCDGSYADPEREKLRTEAYIIDGLG